MGSMLLPQLAFWSPGPWELGVIAVIALLLFGRRLPEIMRGLGGSMREFRKGLDEGMSDEDKNNEDHKPNEKQAIDHETDRPANEDASTHEESDDKG